MFFIIKSLSLLFFKFYGYEALNILLRILPSTYIIKLLKYYGATIGNNVRILNPLVIHNADKKSKIFKNLIIGNDVFIGRCAFFDLEDKITISNRVTISHFCSIHTHFDFGKSILSDLNIKKSSGSIYIAEDVYIGASVTLLQNIQIGSKAIIAAGSLINKNVDEKTLVAGVPGKLKRSFD
jgi:acetyltransferase-like isoleucine patch superfamily enzyme